eukprot:156749_1
MEEFECMDSITTKFNTIIPEPINFIDKDGNNCIIIIKNNEIYYFNCKKNTITRKIKFASEFQAATFGHCINQQKHKLYVLAVNGRLAVINLHKHIHVSDITYIDEAALMNRHFYASIFIPTIHQLHMINQNIHIIFDVESDNKMSKLSTKEAFFGQVSKLLYNTKCKKLFAFGAGAQFDDIYYYESKYSKRWSSSKYKTPYQMADDYYHILQFDKLFLFIYTVETLSGMAELYAFNAENMLLYNKTILRIPGHTNKKEGFSRNTHSFIDNNNIFHLIDYKVGQHYQKNIFTLLPTDIVNDYKITNEILVFGFIRELKDQFLLYSNMPIYLNQIVVKYQN